jgi:hypothetical protein
MEPKEIWVSSTVELLRDADERAFESMNPIPKVATVSTN